MPTKKKRVGFIPRNNVLEIINRLSFENNLSNSKIINILVEEALSQRGILDIKTGIIDFNSDKCYVNESQDSLFKNPKRNRISDVKSNLVKNDISYAKELNNDFVDSEIYEKFLMFLQFKEKMKKNINP